MALLSAEFRSINTYLLIQLYLKRETRQVVKLVGFCIYGDNRSFTLLQTQTVFKTCRI